VCTISAAARSRHVSSTGGMEILECRYARGELSHEKFEVRRWPRSNTATIVLLPWAPMGLMASASRTPYDWSVHRKWAPSTIRHP
jgi:hypothetical protein